MGKGTLSILDSAQRPRASRTVYRAASPGSDISPEGWLYNLEWFEVGSTLKNIVGPGYWNGLPFFSLGDLPDPGIEPASPAWQVDSLPLSHLESPENLLDAVKYHRISVQQTYS